MTEDSGIRQRISDLVAQERTLREQLRAGEVSPPAEQERLRAVETELDQCWDLLRQRDAAREFGTDPDDAQVRDAGTVENYLD
ncbi:DUF2630 family protein [Cellulosimicrobium sp. CUA-896]|uniref:DUF2630 family protein n=1 Tax=Cellulosimicrobium sp. CUA-896 TaxID=1517881 RepID=UPI000965AA22|nr:DUF2630 family protein [Cellulosimicrobium sp. CUA-896]OLT49130.1 hypothetical protein BJF88_16385 [Cellulosimicrobium sp. CUA-896]